MNEFEVRTDPTFAEPAPLARQGLRRHRRPFGAVLLAVSGLTLAACSSSGGASSPGSTSSGSTTPTGSLQSVSFTYPGAVGITLPEQLIQSDPSMCHQYGIDPKVTIVANSAAQPGVAAGSIDATRGAPSSFLLTDLSSPGAAKIVAQVTGGQVNKFWVSKDIQAVAGLKGKTVAATSVGSTTDLGARAVLSEAGLTPDKDVKITYTNTPTALLGLALAGRIQALIQPAPLPPNLVSAGWHAVAVPSTDPRTAPLFFTDIVANTKFIQNHPSAVKGLLQCEAAAAAAINADHAKASALLAKDSGVDVSAAAAQVASLQPFGVAKFKPSDVTTLATLLQANKVGNFQGHDLSQAVDSSNTP